MSDEKKIVIIFIVLFCFIIGSSVFIYSCNKSEQIVDNAFIHYEEFQEIYNTCVKINTDLGTILAIPESDKMFLQFSKQAQIAAKKQSLSRWVEEYNAKSKMWNRSMWKSASLPYQLDVNQFSNFKG